MEQIQKFLPLLLRLVAGLVGLEGKVVLSTMTELLVDQVVVGAVQRRGRKVQRGLEERQHLDRVIMVVLKLFRIFQEWAEEEVEQLVDRPLEARPLELLDLVVQAVFILELPMLVVVEAGIRTQQEEQAEAEAVAMGVRGHKMVLMARQTWVVVAGGLEQLDHTLAALEVAGLLLSATQSNGPLC
jgi:hypothetical protein